MKIPFIYQRVQPFQIIKNGINIGIEDYNTEWVVILKLWRAMWYLRKRKSWMCCEENTNKRYVFHFWWKSFKIDKNGWEKGPGKIEYHFDSLMFRYYGKVITKEMFDDWISTYGSDYK